MESKRKITNQNKNINLNHRKFDIKLAIIILFFSISIGLAAVLFYFFFKRLCLSSPDTIDPISFQVANNSDSSVQVSWDRSLRASYYYVYVKEGSPPGQTFYDQRVKALSTTFRFTNLTPEKRWYFSVQAFNNCGSSGLTVSKFVIPCPIVGNTSIVSTNVLPQSLLTDYPYRLSISESLNATQYLVEIYELNVALPNSPGSLVASQTFTNNDCTSTVCNFNQIDLVKFPTSGLQYKFQVTPSNSCAVGTTKSSTVTFI